MDKLKDLYLLLGVDPEAEESVIKKSYRKKALSCHPDKNPDNPKAAELFHQLSEALNVLTDEKARKAYDNVLKAKKANELRNRLLDSKRKKLKDDLEAREKAAFQGKSEEVLAGERLKAEIERLQKEGQKQLEEEQERLQQMMREEGSTPNPNSSQVSQKPTKVKLRWKVKESTQEYNKESLKRIFCKYGQIGDIIIMENKKEKSKCSALVEFDNFSSASMAVSIEKGYTENPFRKIELIEENVTKANNVAKNDINESSTKNVNFNDFETIVMRQMRQAEERKRLIEEMERQDAEQS